MGFTESASSLVHPLHSDGFAINPEDHQIQNTSSSIPTDPEQQLNYFLDSPTELELMSFLEYYLQNPDPNHGFNTDNNDKPYIDTTQQCIDTAKQSIERLISHQDTSLINDSRTSNIIPNDGCVPHTPKQEITNFPNCQENGLVINENYNKYQGTVSTCQLQYSDKTVKQNESFFHAQVSPTGNGSNSNHLNDDIFSLYQFDSNDALNSLNINIESANNNNNNVPLSSTFQTGNKSRYDSTVGSKSVEIPQKKFNNQEKTLRTKATSPVDVKPVEKTKDKPIRKRSSSNVEKLTKFLNKDEHTLSILDQEFYNEAQSRPIKHRKIEAATTARGVKNAVNARVNRQRHKLYVESLEKEIAGLKRQNEDVETRYKNALRKIDDLENHITYLKRVMSNDSDLTEEVSSVGQMNDISINSINSTMSCINE